HALNGGLGALRGRSRRQEHQHADPHSNLPRGNVTMRFAHSLTLSKKYPWPFRPTALGRCSTARIPLRRRRLVHFSFSCRSPRPGFPQKSAVLLLLQESLPG